MHVCQSRYARREWHDVSMVDRVLVVDVDESTQRARACQTRRSKLNQQIENIMASQATREQRLAVADDVVNNEGSPDQTADQVKDAS